MRQQFNEELAKQAAEREVQNMLRELDPYRKEISKILSHAKQTVLYKITTGEVEFGYDFNPEQEKIIDHLNKKMDEIEEKYRAIIKDIGVCYGVIKPEEQV